MKSPAEQNETTVDGLVENKEPVVVIFNGQ